MKWLIPLAFVSFCSPASWALEQAVNVMHVGGSTVSVNSDGGILVHTANGSSTVSLTGFPLVPTGVNASTTAVVNGGSPFNATINTALPSGTNALGNVIVTLSTMVPTGVNASTVAVVNGGSTLNATINAALPSGTNTLGSVNVVVSTLMPTGVSASTVAVVNGGSTFNATINAALPAGTNNIGLFNVGISTMVPTGANASTVAVVNGGSNLTVQPGNTPNTAPWLVVNSTMMVHDSADVSRTVGYGTGMSSVPVNVLNTPAVSQSGTWTVQPGNTPNTAPWLVVDSTMMVHDSADVSRVIGYGVNMASVPVTLVGDESTSGGGPITRFVRAGGYDSTANLDYPLPITGKGNQPGKSVSVSQMIDTGRTYIILVATAVAGVTAEAMIKFQSNKAGTVTNSTGTYTITNNKTLRITHFGCSSRDGAATISWSRFVLHVSTGSAGAGTPMLYGIEVGDSAALAGGTGTFTAPLPEGIEIAGNGVATIGVSQIDSATTNLDTCTVLAYEY